MMRDLLWTDNRKPDWLFFFYFFCNMVRKFKIEVVSVPLLSFYLLIFELLILLQKLGFIKNK